MVHRLLTTTRSEPSIIAFLIYILYTDSGPVGFYKRYRYEPHQAVGSRYVSADDQLAVARGRRGLGETWRPAPAHGRLPPRRPAAPAAGSPRGLSLLWSRAHVWNKIIHISNVYHTTPSSSKLNHFFIMKARFTVIILVHFLL